MTTTYNAAQAARVCGITVRTIQRRAQELLAAGAWKDTGGEWHIPLQALRDIGLTPGRPLRGDTRTSNGKPRVAGGDTSGRLDDYTEARVAELEEQNHILLRRAEVAETAAAERAETIAALRQTVQVLEAPRHTPVAPPVAPSPPTATASPRTPRRPLLARLRRSQRRQPQPTF